MKKYWILGVAALVSAAPLMGYVTSKSVSADQQIVQNKWAGDGFPIQWRMNPVRGQNIEGIREQVDLVRDSFTKWQALTAATISFSEGTATDAGVKPALDGINLVTTNISAADFASSALGLTFTFFFDRPGIVASQDPLERVSQFAGQIFEADIAFNPNRLFSTDMVTPSNRIDFESVAVHEIGHLLGLDHTGLVSATMFPTIGEGFSYPRTLSTDDIAGVSTIYPSTAFPTKGRIAGTVRTTANAPVYGALVVAVNAAGQPAASAITDPNGAYIIEGLDAGAYTVYAEPIDQPLLSSDVPTLARIFPGSTVFTNFTTRFR